MSGGRFEAHFPMEPCIYNYIYIYMVYASCMVKRNFNVYTDVTLWYQIPEI